MDSETMQLLNLSPIPELSELELSTMLDQLSGLSDINTDLTDRNVEDILKEAEDLIDKSSSSKDNVSSSTSKNAEVGAKNEVDIYRDLAKPNEKIIEGQEISLKCDMQTAEENVQNSAIDKSPCSPVEQVQEKIFSKGCPANHIKSTIESLKEFSNIIEKQISSSSQSSSPRSKCRTDTRKKEKEEYSNCEKKISSKDDQSSLKFNLNKSENLTSDMKSSKEATQYLESYDKDVELDPVNLSKTIKYLNCFERLYQNRPVRLSSKKPKMSEKVPKTLIKKKSLKDSKSHSSLYASRDKKQTKCFANKKVLAKGIRNENITETRQHNFSLKTNNSKMAEVENWLGKGDNKDLLLEFNNHKLISQLEGFSEGESESEVSLKCLETEERKSSPKAAPKPSSNSELIHSEREEKLILKLLHEMEEIKNHIRMTGGIRNNENHEKMSTKECQTVNEVNLLSNQEENDSTKNVGIRRLEEKFLTLKEKYDKQMEKLEMENENLRELLNSRKNVSVSQKQTNTDVSTSTEDRFNEEVKSCCVCSGNTEMKIIRSVSLENCKAPVNSPCSAVHLPAEEKRVARKESYSQTEKDLMNASVQCCCEEDDERREERDSTKEEEAIICEEIKRNFETRKMENKENLGVKKKTGRVKPFSDMNVHQLLKQKKKISDHETQLLATLRGLQSEVTVKDKENRKLKTEIDLLKAQIKRLNKNKFEGPKKCHVGSQTVGLGPVVQRPYDPSVYEVTDDLEKENEELKSKLKVLEDGFELLKEKRINDLQTLHQVHQEEMAKLASRLETQSALTRHFHSLLVNQ